MWGRLLGFVLMATSAISAACHGFIVDPASRNLQRNSNHCPHCLAAGGPGKTFEGGKTWPNSLHGVCGDAYDAPKDHEAGGKFATPKKIAAVYIQGQTIAIRMKITAPHGGRFSFGICPVPKGITPDAERKIVTQACFDAHRLTNAADGTQFWWFGKKGNGDYTMQFKLPSAILCDVCTFQWHWESGNSCTIPGTPREHVMGDGLVSCVGSAVMEEFWNCADVSILKPGSSLPPAPRAVAMPMNVTTSPIVDKQLRQLRLQQAEQLRKEAMGLPAALRGQALAKVKSLVDMAHGGAGEGFATYDAYGSSPDGPSSGPMSASLLILAVVAMAGAVLPLVHTVAVSAGMVVVTLVCIHEGGDQSRGRSLATSIRVLFACMLLWMMSCAKRKK